MYLPVGAHRVEPVPRQYFVATDAPSHVDHVLKVLAKGKHVMCAVPVLFGKLEDVERLLKAVKKNGKIYALNETSAFHDQVYASRKIYEAAVSVK